jgi:uncharacterized membrane protein
MLKLIIGLVLFFGMHSASVVALPLRDGLAASKPLVWKAVYSLVSLAGFVLIIFGYAEARTEPIILYTPPAWLYYVPAILLLPMFILLLAPYFPGWISRTTRHPQLIAAKSWALTHLLVNGALADVLLFSSFVLWGGAVRLSLKYREPRPLPSASTSKANDVMLVIVGLAAYFVFVHWAHQAWFGVDPLIMFGN